MKKFFLFLVIVTGVLCCLLNASCAGRNVLEDKVSELKQDLFEGNSENYTLKAFYGFKEDPFIKDGKVGETKYCFCIKLLNKVLEPATYTVSFIFNDTTYRKDFTKDVFTNNLECCFEIENFGLKELPVLITCAENSEKVTLKSTVCYEAISYKQVLDILLNEHSELIGAFTDGDAFNAELYLRIVVKDEKPYWFVGIATSSELKAFLIDGLNGELLAVRNVY